MHYELYVDSLFLLNFIMNLFLLLLVDRSTFRLASPGRLATGAAVGAACFLLPFLEFGPTAWRLAIGVLGGTVGMLCITFPVRNLRMLLKLLERLTVYSFGMGGAMLFLLRLLPGLRESMASVPGILGMGVVFLLLLGRSQGSPAVKSCLCRAVLFRKGERMEVTALIDSGNSLTEPISGKPVCVVGGEVYHRLWKGDRSGFRAIPFHSIGKRRGILAGYLLPELMVEMDGMELRFTDVYIAVSDERISGEKGAAAESVNMIINPRLLAESGREGRGKRQNERQNDTESHDTGQDAI